jgi:hypothetical protein
LLNVFESVVHKEKECSEKRRLSNALPLCCEYERFNRR